MAIDNALTSGIKNLPRYGMITIVTAALFTVSCSTKLSHPTQLSDNGKGGDGVRLDAADSCQFTFPQGAGAVRGSLVSVDFVANYTIDAINANIPQGLPLARNAVDAFKVTYNSVDLEGKTVVLSGLIMVPTTCAKEYPAISLQHYTLLADKEQPSVTGTHGLYEASQGYYTISPDYIGYGSSSDVFHPYLIADGYGESLVDMLRAARSLASQNGVDVQKNLFLKGYSEGGYATMALLRTLEKPEHRDEFKVTAAAPSDGPYNLYSISAGAMALDKSNVFGPFIVTAYQQTLSIADMKLADILQSTDTIDYVKIFAGDYDGATALTMIPQTMATLFQPVFMSKIATDFKALAAGQHPELTPFEIALIQNSFSLNPWKVRTPTKFFHCQDDDLVPVGIAQEAYANFRTMTQKVGTEIIASPTGVTYTHQTCPALYSPIQWFDGILAGHTDALIDAAVPVDSVSCDKNSDCSGKDGKDGKDGIHQCGKDSDYYDIDCRPQPRPQPGQNQNQGQNQSQNKDGGK